MTPAYRFNPAKPSDNDQALRIAAVTKALRGPFPACATWYPRKAVRLEVHGGLVLSAPAPAPSKARLTHKVRYWYMSQGDEWLAVDSAPLTHAAASKARDEHKLAGGDTRCEIWPIGRGEGPGSERLVILPSQRPEPVETMVDESAPESPAADVPYTGPGKRRAAPVKAPAADTDRQVADMALVCARELDVMRKALADMTRERDGAMGEADQHAADLVTARADLAAAVGHAEKVSRAHLAEIRSLTSDLADARVQANHQAHLADTMRAHLAVLAAERDALAARLAAAPAPLADGVPSEIEAEGTTYQDSAVVAEMIEDEHTRAVQVPAYRQAAPRPSYRPGVRSWMRS